MERILLRLTFSACVIIGAIALNSYSSGGFTSDLTGSPLSSTTCQNGCHNSFSLNSGSGSVSMSAPATYYPGNSYSVSLTVSQSTPAAGKYGFMAGALRDNNANGGTFVAGTGSAVTSISGRSYIRQTSVANTTGTWSFTWNAPSFADTIIFYYSGNAANANFSNSGDYIYTGSTTIYPIPLITFSIDSTDVTCDDDCDGVISISNVSGGSGGPYSYAWSNSATTSTISNLCAGTYTVTIEDASGNEEVRSIDVDGPAPINVNFNTVGTTCVSGDGSISTQVNGGTPPYSYLWSNANTTSAITSAQVGWYSLTVTDANGCTEVDSVEVAASGSGLVVVLDSIAENCGNADGSITVTVINGNPPYTYTWSNGGTTQTINGLSAGIFTVTILDNNGCQDQFTSQVIAQDAILDVSGTSVVDIDCFGENSGSIETGYFQALEPVTYTWSSGQTGPLLTGLAAGTYTVTLTDDAGCTDEASFTVDTPDSLSVEVIVDSANEAFCDGAINLIVSGGTQPYTYLWSHDAANNTATANNLCAGEYTITLTDLNGCEVVIGAEVGSLTGVAQLGTSLISIYPNPTSSLLYINAAPGAISSYEIKDMVGRTIMKWEQAELRVLDLSLFETGRYNLLIRNNDGLVLKPVMISR